MDARFPTLVSVLLAGACTVPRGQMPSTPSYYDLMNDGSAPRQEELRRRYAVKTDRDSVHVGDAVRTRGRADGPFPTDWEPVHPEVRTYIAGDKQAAAHLPAPWMLAPFGSALVVGAVAAVAVPVGLAAAGVGALAFLIGGKPTFAGPWNLVDDSSLPVVGAVLSLAAGAGWALVCAVAVGPLLAGGVAGLWWLNRRFTEARDIFNRNLDKRIADAAQVPGAAPPVPVTPPR
ncbi:MAG: hypothetical protein HY904_23435 [Deltaproteobacteria bacterium]|nr:hypothetical protein [Deltaproteobacteria bacterium]